MPIPAKCPKCGRTYNVRDELAGQKAKCACGEAVSVPERSSIMDLLDEDLAAAGATLDSGPGQAGSPLLPTPRGRKRNANPALIAAIVGGCLVGILLMGVLVYMFSGGGEPTVANNAPTTDSPSPNSAAPLPSPAGSTSPPPPPPSVGSTPPPPPPTSGGSSQPARSRKTPPRGPGYESPEALFEALKRAKDTATRVNMLTPESVDEEVLGKIARLHKLSRSKPDAKGVLERHGITDQVLNAEQNLAARAKRTLPKTRPGDIQGLQGLVKVRQEMNDLLLNAVDDKYQFLIDARDFITASTGQPVSEFGRRYKEEYLKILPEIQLKDVRFRRDRAAGDVSFTVLDETTKRTHYFQRINDRWYLQTGGSLRTIPKNSKR